VDSKWELAHRARRGAWRLAVTSALATLEGLPSGGGTLAAGNGCWGVVNARLGGQYWDSQARGVGVRAGVPGR
jgi:hypothetical protein